ncbi:MAG: NnrU family protein [Pseudomonadota bacterium]
MFLLVLGMALFVLAHGLKIHAPSSRERFVGQMGEMPVRGAAAVAIFASVVLIVLGYQQAPFVNIWTPPAWATHLNNLLMVIAIGVFIAGTFKSHIRHWIRHPQITGVKIWAVAHLLVNGDLASIILFGGMLGWAVAAMIGVNKRDGKGPKPAAGTMKGNLIHAGVTVALVIGVALAHNWAGVWPFAGSPPG